MKRLIGVIVAIVGTGIVSLPSGSTSYGFGQPGLLVALLGSAVGRTIVWRGIAYQMVSRTHTVVHRPHVAVSSTAGHRASEKANVKR